MSDLMTDGFNLALFGMGYVFTFLIMLVFLTILMTSVIRRLAPAPLVTEKRRAQPRKPTARQADTAEQSRLIAAISAAIRQHRSGAD